MTAQENNITQLIRNRINKQDPTAEIILFGSHARGNATSESDWDILILLNFPEVTREMEMPFRNEIYDVMYETGEFISTFILSKQEWESKFTASPFYKNVKLEGKRL